MSKCNGEPPTANNTPARSPTHSSAIDDDNTDFGEAPSVGKILKFAGPAIGVWLCNPLLSLIDTSAVGVFAGTTQQAAMHPAVSVTDYSALLVAFLYTGTTNLIATAREQDISMHLEEGAAATTNTRAAAAAATAHHRWPVATKTFIGALQLSILVGGCLGIILLIYAPSLLSLLIGSSNEKSILNPVVFDVAVRFVRIRALGMPAAAAIGSFQAASLGMQDTMSPLYVLLTAAVVNILGDVLWVRSSHRWFGGAAGSAWSTVISQYVALYLLVQWLCDERNSYSRKQKNIAVERRWMFLRRVPFISNFTGAASAGEDKRKKVTGENADGGLRFSVRGFLRTKFSVRYLVRIPPAKTFQQYKPFVIPVTVTQIGRISGYIAMSHAVSSSMGTVAMASQQVVVSLFYCLCPIADSLSLTAQSFVPSFVEKRPSMARSKALRRTLVNFLAAGAIFGFIISVAVLLIPTLSSLFTSDQDVVAVVEKVAYPLLVAWFSVHGIVCSTEGILLGQRDLRFLGGMYGLYFFIVPFAILQVKEYVAATPSGEQDDQHLHQHPLIYLWQVFLVYQLSRFAAWLARALYMQRRIEREAAQLGHYD